MPATRELRRRIKSIKSTGQITKAMELMSASKMRKASQAVIAGRPYADRSQAILQDILQGDETSHAFTEQRPAERALIIAISSDRGLAGAYNATIIKQALLCAHQHTSASFITIGKKIESALAHFDYPLLQSYPVIPSAPTIATIQPITQFALRAFEHAEFDRVYLIYTRFVSMLRQEMCQELILPFIPQQTGRTHEFLYEPDVEYVLNMLLPRFIESQVYHGLLESIASEHSARRLAMKSATDNAKDILDDLSLTYNGLRQSAITQEIAEITSGATALAS